MKKSYRNISIIMVFSTLVVLFSMFSCKKTENPIKYELGTFPDSTYILTDINSGADDYGDLNLVTESLDSETHTIYGDITMVFTSNRTGGKTDLIQGYLAFAFKQTDGNYGIRGGTTSDAFLTKLINAANTTRNDLGPYRLFSPSDGNEYLILSSENSSGNLDFFYLKNAPEKGTTLPSITGPLPATLINTSSDDAYICFDINKDSAYFSSNIAGNYNIYVKKKLSEMPLDTWLSSTYTASNVVDSINTGSDDKCPYVYKKIMVFASNRPGGMGGYDLYYSVFKNGKWNSPVNFGPDVNTSADEIRPILTAHSMFTNQILIFSSNRPGGKGGFDIYAKGVSVK